MAVLLRFASTRGIPSDKKTQRVYLREQWSSEWVHAVNLWCEEAVWSVVPTMPTASLVWLYGDILQPGTIEFRRFLRREINRLFVKVEYETDGDELLVWNGVIESDNDRVGGSRLALNPPSLGAASAVATGDQFFTAYGLEWLLASEKIKSAVVDSAGGDITTDTPPIFNHRGVGNKAIGKLSFSNDPDASERWTSLGIVAYLLKHQTPKKLDGSVGIKFLPFAADIPNWDQPEMPQQGATTYELISQLVTPRRGIAGYFLDVGGDIELRTDTFTETEIPIPLPIADPVKANGRPLHLVYDDDEQTSATIQTSTVELYDQVLYRGDRRRSVGSFSSRDSTIEEGWTYDEESAYLNGASGTQVYGIAGTKEKRRLDESVRGSHSLSTVFNYFRIPKTWDRKTGDGEGGTKRPMFPAKDEFGVISATPAFVFYPDMRVEQSMPLIEGVDYSEDKIKDATFILQPSERNEAAPFAAMKVPAKTEWRNVSDIGKNADLEITNTENEFNRWSGSIRIPADGKGLHVDVHGCPQHVLDGMGFSYLPTDETLGKWSFRDTRAGMIFTLSIPDDRYCEGEYPTTAELKLEESSSMKIKSYVKTKLLTADGFRKDYVVPLTVVGVSAAGELLRTTGGFIPKESDGDDEHKLAAAAKIAAIYYTKPHSILSLSTYRIQPASKIRLAALVVKVGDPVYGEPRIINSPVTEIRVTSPMGDLNSSEAPRMDVMTWAGELDPLLVAPLEPTDDHSRPAAVGLAYVQSNPDGSPAF